MSIDESPSRNIILHSLITIEPIRDNEPTPTLLDRHEAEQFPQLRIHGFGNKTLCPHERCRDKLELCLSNNDTLVNYYLSPSQHDLEKRISNFRLIKSRTRSHDSPMRCLLHDPFVHR